MKYCKRKDISVLYQPPCNGGISSRHEAKCFHNLRNNQAASSSVSIAQETRWIPKQVQMLWRNEKNPCLWWKSFIPLSFSLWLSHYSYWPITVPFVRMKYKKKYMDLREGGYGGMNWTEMYVIWSSDRFFLQINQPTGWNNFTGLSLDVYVWLNVFRAPLRPSSGVYNCIRSLWFYRYREAAEALLVIVSQDNLPDHDQQRCNHHAPTVEPEAPSAVVRSWWWAERRPKHVEPHTNVKW